MAQLKEIRNRIVSVKNTRQVTSAMKMVSAAKLKKAQDSILQILPYDNKLMQIIRSLSANETNIESSVYFSSPEVKSVLILVIGANRGLCGAFNANVAKKALMHAVDNYSELLGTGNVHFLPVGKQVEKELKNRGAICVGESNYLIDKVNYDLTAMEAEKLMKLFSDRTYQRIDIVYNKFKNAAVQILTAEQYLPVAKEIALAEDAVKEKQIEYIYEPSQHEILVSLVPQSLKIHLYKVLLDSFTAENGARMTAMHLATDNATELLKELRTSYNNARQAAITNEIMEITAGAEALK